LTAAGSMSRSSGCSASALQSAGKSPFNKREHQIPMMQPARVIEARERYLARGTAAEIPADFTAAMFELLIDATCRMEDELIAGADAIEQGAR
jgi:hypothetical protein